MQGNPPTSLPLLCLSGRPALLDAGGARPLVLKYRKGFALLGFLASHANRVFRRETLAELLWPGIDSGAGRANLRVVLADLGSALRKLELPEVLEVQRDWLALRPGRQLQTDVALLDSLCSPGANGHPQSQALLEQLGQATTSWLEDAEDGTSDDFREWLSAQRHHLQHARDLLFQAAPDLEEDAPSAEPVGTAPAEAPPLQPGAPQMSILTLLRVELDDTQDTGHLNLFSTQPRMLETVCSEVQFFDGMLLDHDDAGCTFVFGLDSQHTGQRWQALRCACSVFGQLGGRHQVRMGVSSGKMLLTQDKPPRVMGWRRRLVDRLALSADIGELVCDESLLDLVQHFGCTPLGERRFRGMNPSFQLYRRRLADTPPLLLPPGGDFAGGFFGREAFLEGPAQIFGQVGPGAARGLCIRGEPGVGKTRVAWEFAQRCQAGGHLTFWIGALPEAAGVPWRGLHDFFSKVFTGAGSPEQQLDRAEKTLQARVGPEARAAILSLLHSRGVPQGQRNALAEGISALLRGQGRQRALVVIDDVQWLDAPSAEILNRVIGHADAVLWLMTCRSRERNPLQVPGLQELPLKRLDDATADAILSSLPDADLLSSEARRGRIANARGLPLYLLADSVPQDSGSHFSEFCQALLNRLGQARAPMEAAAVLGMLFSLDDLGSLCGAHEARQAWDRALASGLLVARGPVQASFFHPRLREHLLSVTAPETLQRHATEAAGLLGARGQAAEAAVLWEQAARNDAAREAWYQAALQAKAEDDISAACSHCEHLARLDYLEGVEGLRARILHANCLIARDGYGSAIAHQVMAGMDELQVQALQLDQHERYSMLCLSYLWASGQAHEDSLPYARRMEQTAETPTQRYLATWARSNSYFWLGRFDEARVWFERNLEAGLKLSPQERRMYFPSDPAVFARCELAWMLWLTGDWAGSQQVINEAQALAEASSTRQDLCIAHCFKALCNWMGGDPLQLAIHAAQALEIADAEGFSFWRAVASLLVAMARAHAGEAIDLAPLAKEADSVLQGYRAAIPTAMWFASQALVASAQPELALQLLEQTLVLSGDGSHAYCMMDLWRLKAEALASLQRPQESAAAWRHARQVAMEAGAHGWLRRWQLQLDMADEDAYASDRAALSDS
ncbi:MAG: AAA family ATPase [Curvibacter sp.]|nr:AAA family ATPase [Curvibacter sp.]